MTPGVARRFLRHTSLLGVFRRDRMARTVFLGRAAYVRELSQPLEHYASKRSAPGALGHLPEFASRSRIMGMMQKPPAGFTTIAGLTVATFSVDFENAGLQWKKMESRAGVTTWQFTGGTVFLSATINVFVDERLRRRKAALELVMAHEMLHVGDEIDIVKHHLPGEMAGVDMVKKYLIEQKPVDDRMYQHFFKGGKLTGYVEGVWADEHNRRAQGRDSGQAYREYGEQVSLLEQTGN
jgi:hypothetical protein